MARRQLRQQQQEEQQEQKQQQQQGQQQQSSADQGAAAASSLAAFTVEEDPLFNAIINGVSGEARSSGKRESSDTAVAERRDLQAPDYTYTPPPAAPSNFIAVWDLVLQQQVRELV